MNSKRMLVAVGSAAAVVALVAGCTSDESDDNATTSATTSASVSASGTAEQGGPHNDADVEYVQMMIPHHEQAVEMAELVPSRTGNPDIIALADQIEKAQGPEIEQMEGWLKAWGAPEPSKAEAPGATSDGMDHDGMEGDGTSMPMQSMPMTSMNSMPGMEGGGHGMMSAEQMQALENAKDAEFDKMWLELMIAHHQGAVASSEQILQTGESEQVRQLAQQIVSSQQAEIAQMEALLNK
ncbi:DUF305 domain-containing protein [Rhodococcus hoagii]|jgi:uncharacterized protein (DUF305 family)|uniref:DUF305 domain-containing protein n=2 Tax=Rhodococcus hoagii TaxID=43767 RepID=A0A9Q5AB58_RHOHA|nr:DUF305 domain-containing protein [Prescottella equi]MBU4617440.1 DUF305 domain-containing protein [Rhodococcus sp. GG48]ERN46509.1 lipoprotein [Prescottella equi NBRC 101255 = C 7]MBM4470437.1 DUF305 domain-containing protein [Prescottella equi]MBM4478706.1 DUF305 domain-containing protein [Prescottella equi]MBM4492380.1 DUF305 domain-containing protein [Prescottella equi]